MAGGPDAAEASPAADGAAPGAHAPPAAGVAAAEAALRARYGAPVSGDRPGGKAVGFQLPDGRQIALQRDVGAITVWIEAGASGDPPWLLCTSAVAQAAKDGVEPRVSAAGARLGREP